MDQFTQGILLDFEAVFNSNSVRFSLPSGFGGISSHGISVAAAAVSLHWPRKKVLMLVGFLAREVSCFNFFAATFYSFFKMK